MPQHATLAPPDRRSRRANGTLDGLAIAQAICESLLGLEEQAPLVLFATHFHELCSLTEHWSLVGATTLTSRPSKIPPEAARRCSRIAFNREARRARLGLRSRGWPGCPEPAIARAQEIADALSGEDDIETRVPLRQKMPKRPAPERQLSFLAVNGSLTAERREDGLQGEDDREGADDHRRRPCDDIEQRSVRLLAHQPFVVDENEHQDEENRQQHSVEDLRVQNDGEQRRAGDNHSPGSEDDERERTDRRIFWRP